MPPGSTVVVVAVTETVTGLSSKSVSKLVSRPGWAWEGVAVAQRMVRIVRMWIRRVRIELGLRGRDGGYVGMVSWFGVPVSQQGRWMVCSR